MFLILFLNSILNILIFLINFSYVGSLPVEPLLLLESLGETHGLSDFVSGGYVREVEEKRERERESVARVGYECKWWILGFRASRLFQVKLFWVLTSFFWNRLVFKWFIKT